MRKKEGAKEKEATKEELPAESLPILAALGKQVRTLRMSAGLSQHQFAEQVGTSHTYIVSIEAGVPNVSVAMLHKMAQALGVTIAAFFPTDEDADPIDPVLAKISSELHRVANAMDSRRDAIGTIMEQLAARLKKSKR